MKKDFILNKGFLQNFIAVFIALFLIFFAYIANFSKLVYAGECSIYNNQQNACISVSGCNWDTQDCSAYDESGCSLHSGDGCSSNYSNCSWNGSSCDGGGACSGIGDEFNCSSTSYFTSCSGSFNPGTCSGTFDDTGPTLSSAQVEGTTLILVYDEALDTNLPSTGYFTVYVNGAQEGPAAINISGTDVILTLGQSVGGEALVSISYNPMTNPILRDIVGNAAGSLNTQEVLNTTPPVISSVSPATSAYINNVTSSTDIAFATSENLGSGSVTITRTSGTADGNSPHTCTLNGTALNVGAKSINLSDTTNGCTSNVSNLVSGTVYTFVFAGTDAANNGATPITSTSVTFDNTTPSAPSTPDLSSGSDSGSYSTDDITSDNTPTFDITCENATTVTLLKDATSLGTGTCSGGIVSITSSSLSDGVHTIKTRQTDLAGNVSSDSSTLSVTIDTTLPATTGTPDMTTGTDSGSSSTDNLTSDPTPDFSITCETNSTVTLYVDGVAGQTGTCTSSSATITSATLSGGIEITAEQTDVAGNTSASLSSALSVTIDTTAPVTSGAPDLTSGTDSGSSSSDNTTSDTTPTFTGSCTDGTTVQLYDDGVSSGSSATCASSVFSLTTGTLATGSNSITFKETDTAGNTSSASTALVITIDGTGPTISEDAPIATATDTTPAYSFTSDEAGTITYGGSCSSATTNALASTNPIALDTLAVGTYSDCTIIVTDTAGNASNTLTITSFTISAPASPSEPEVQASTNISGSAPTRTNTNTNTNTNNDTPDLPACSAGESFNRNTGLPCTNNTPVIPGCSAGLSFSILTGQSCNTPKPTNTPNTPTPTDTPTTFKFTKDLELGDVDPEVKLLQQYLNAKGFTVTLTGNGSKGQEITTFGPATKAALIKFQKANGITPSVGFFGPKTRGYINEMN